MYCTAPHETPCSTHKLGVSQIRGAALPYPFQIEVIEYIHDILRAGVEVSLVVFVGDVPAEWSKLASLLDRGVQEGHCVEHWLPLREIGVVDGLLARVGVGPLDAGTHALRRLKGVLDGGLQEVDGVLVVHFSGQPQPEAVVDALCIQDCLKQLLKEVQGQVCVLQESPATL